MTVNTRTCFALNSNISLNQSFYLQYELDVSDSQAQHVSLHYQRVHSVEPGLAPSVHGSVSWPHSELGCKDQHQNIVYHLGKECFFFLNIYSAIGILSFKIN